MSRYTRSLMIMLLLAAQPLYAGSFVVRSTADAGVHSLRWAILQANASAGPDVISFDLSGEGPHVIAPTSPLPPLTDPAGVIIDGLSQNGASSTSKPSPALRLRIMLDGRQAGDAPGIWILSSSNRIQGLIIGGFSEDGIRIQGTRQGTVKNVVRHCIIGLAADGRTALPNGTGARSNHWAGIAIVSLPHSPGIAYENLLFGNIVSGNNGDGILLADCMGGRVYANSITANQVGSNAAGDAPVGNERDGILLYGGCYGNTISGNLVVGNGSDGIHIVGDQKRNAQAHHNIIKKNLIGITAGSIPIGNALNGLNIGGKEYEYPGGFASNNTISGNTVSANGRNGVSVWEYPGTIGNAIGNRISQNTIWANAGIGIDLADDALSGGSAAATPGGKLSPPSIVEAEFGRGVATVRGSVAIRGKADLLTIELYKQGSGPSHTCPGPVYLGAASPDAEGVWLFSTNGMLEAGDSVAALLIDDVGNTSEFAAYQPVQARDFSDNEAMVDLHIGKSRARANAILRDPQPNPTKDFTEITLDVVKPCWSILEIYTIKCELVQTLIDRWLPLGEHTVRWDRTNWRGMPVEAGTYICRLDADGVRQTTIITIR
jgi:parallel beta-helix repeat protein